ncbi:MAG: hypothetical protein R2793_06640 [Flavobacteriaceae bacterium]
MEELSNKQDEILKRMVKELPLEQPSPGFSAKVLQQLEVKSALKRYRPLIPRRVLVLCGILFSLALVWVYWNPENRFFTTNPTTVLERLDIKNPLASLHVSKTTLYAFAFMALFLVQIPFLKRMLEKHHL